MDLDINLDDLPEHILEREHILIEQTFGDDESLNMKNKIEIVQLALKAVYEESIDILKNKINICLNFYISPHRQKE